MDYSESLYHSDISGTEIGNIRLFRCGERNDAPDHSHGPASRENYWFIFVKEGTGFYETNKKRHRIQKNTVFVTFPNKLFYYRADPGSVWSIRWISVGSGEIEQYLSLMHIFEDSPVISVNSPLAVDSVLQILLDEAPKETESSKFLCIGLVYQFLSLLVADRFACAEKRDYLEDALFFVSNNYHRDISVFDIAKSVRLAPAYFARLFKERMGVPPSSWLNSYRLEKSAGLLESTDLKINEIARSVGFSDPLYFSRRFSEKYHISPQEFRKKLLCGK